MAAEDQSASPEPPAPAPSGSAAALLPPGLVFADTPSRLAAYLLDGLLLSVIVSIPPAVLGLYDYAAGSGAYPEPMSRATFVGVTVFTFAVQAAYFLWFWTGGRRATPGQRVFGIQIGNAFDGRPLTMTQAIERWLAMGWWATLLVLLPFFAVAMASYVIFVAWWVVLVISMIVSPTKQGIHDRFARSALVRPAGQSNRWAVGCLWVYGLLTALSIAFLVLIFSILNTYNDPNLYPPGMNPFDYLNEQIRELWPS
jgi:uncharacterized RDD family membrane protein YckC